MPDTSSALDPYNNWVGDAGKGYNKILTSPGGWWWRLDGDPDALSRPTLKTLIAGTVALILMTGLYSQTGQKNQDSVMGFRNALTHPEDNTNPVEELRERIMQIARGRADRGLENPRIVTVEIDTETDRVRVLGEEVSSETK